MSDERLDALAKLIAVVDRLREPGGCPWDREQTVASMAPSLVEEAHEALEAIEAGDSAATVEELGDLLMVVTLIARIASEEDSDERRFDLASAARAVAEKLVRRHPHVFGDVEAGSSERAIESWERIKKREREEKAEDASALAGIPLALPALQRAYRIGEKARAAGFRWSESAEALEKLREEVAELSHEVGAGDPERIEEELGDVLLAASFLGVYLRIDPERAARAALRRFEERFRRMEESLGADLAGASQAELLAAWRASKAGESGGPAGTS